MVTKDEPEFFRLLEGFRERAGRLRKPPAPWVGTALHEQRRAFREIRETAYHMVRSYLAMKTECPTAFAERLRSEGLSEDQWTEKWFFPLKSMGESHQRLIEAVKGGMTLDDYLERGSLTPL